MDTEYIQAIRSDLAALCCAGIFISQEHIWDDFVTWMKKADPSFEEHNEEDSQSPADMLLSVRRIDRLSMISLLLTEPDDAEIAQLLGDEL